MTDPSDATAMLAADALAPAGAAAGTVLASVGGSNGYGWYGATLLFT